MYSRKRTRTPRAVEESAAMLRVSQLEVQLQVLKTELIQTRLRAHVAETAADHLLQDKIALAKELREARTLADFLQGFDAVTPQMVRSLF